MFQFVIHLPALPQCPDNLQPAVAQRSVGTRYRMSFVKLLLEISSCPAGMPHTLACQIIDSSTQGVRAGCAKLHRFTLATSSGDRSSTGYRLQRLGGWEAAAVIPNPRQHSCRGQRTGHAGKTQPPVRFGVRTKQGLDLSDQGIFVVKHLATGHQTKVRNRDEWDGIRQG